MAEILRIDNISFRYFGRTNEALKNINLRINENEIVLLAGRSGSGKSSLLRVINGLIPFFYRGDFSGQIFFYDEDITHIPPRERTKKGMATVLQFPEDQILARKVWRAVAFGLANLGFSREEIIKRVKEALKCVDMWSFWDYDTLALSAGQKQKIVLAAALAIQPHLLLLDEPTSQLDPASAQRFLISLKIIREELGMTIIVAEHRFDELSTVADRVILIDDGRIVANGPPRKIFATELPGKLGIGYPKLALLTRFLAPDSNVFLGLEELKNELRRRNCVIQRIDKEYKRAHPKGSRHAIVLDDVWFAYDGEWVLKGFSLSIREGSFVALMGPNGAGKTTLLKLIACIHKPVKGQVFLFSKSTNNLRLKDVVGLVGYMPQNPEEIFFNKTVYDEIAFGLRMQGIKENEVRRRVHAIAKFLRIDHLLEENPFALSGGEKLRVALASVLILDPKILLFDEPTRGIDWETKLSFLSNIKQLVHTRTIVLATHDVELLAELNVNDVIVLNDGRVVLTGNKREVLSNPAIEKYGLVRPKITYLMKSLGAEGIVSINEALKSIRCLK